jgi:hypothetical protein
MKQVKVPGFTANASLYKTTKRYHMAAISDGLPGGVMPQLMISGEDIREAACLAACTCCDLPSPVQPECCGACLACSICDFTDLCAQELAPGSETPRRPVIDIPGQRRLQSNGLPAVLFRA